VAEGINPASTLIPVTRIEGITTALAVPTGNLVSGQAVLIDLDGATIEQMLVRSRWDRGRPVGTWQGQCRRLSRGGGGPVAPRVPRRPTSTSGRKPDFSRAQMRPLSASAQDLEALLPMLHGRVSFIAYANRRSDIETALRLAREFKVKLILAGAGRGLGDRGGDRGGGRPVLVDR